MFKPLHRKPIIGQKPRDTQQVTEKEVGGRQFSNSKTETVVDNVISGKPVIKVEKVPSHWLAYPQNSTISVRTYTFKEILTLSQSSLTMAEEANIIASGIFVDGFDKRDLLYQDFLFLGLLRKVSSYRIGTYSLEFTCPACDSKNKLTEMLGKIPFKEVTVKALPINFTLDNGDVIKLSPLTVGRFLQIIKTDEANFEDDEIRTAHMVVNKPFEEAYKLVSNADQDLLIVLEELDDLFGFGIENLQRECSVCKVVNSIDMNEPEAFIRPFRGYEELIGSKISFGI